VVSEELEGAESTDAEPQSAGVAADPAAVALALASASSSAADAFLRKQSRVAELQAHHLHEQFKQLNEQLKQLRLGVWERRLGRGLRLDTPIGL
jgi:hypothetical protein